MPWNWNNWLLVLIPCPCQCVCLLCNSDHRTPASRIRKWGNCVFALALTPVVKRNIGSTARAIRDFMGSSGADFAGAAFLALYSIWIFLLLKTKWYLLTSESSCCKWSHKPLLIFEQSSKLFINCLLIVNCLLIWLHLSCLCFLQADVFLAR